VRADRVQWSLLVPIKRLSIAKTRIALPAASRALIALAMTGDTVSAALACLAVAEVVAITSDEQVGEMLRALGARVVDDVPDSGLNPALAHGALLATSPHVAALSSDLPALRPADLETVLVLAAAQPLAVVADASGRGTTMLAARSTRDFAPSFGVESLAAHLRAGAVDISAGAPASVRHDVDTLADLELAVRLGVGPQTTRAAAAVAD